MSTGKAPTAHKHFNQLWMLPEKANLKLVTVMDLFTLFAVGKNKNSLPSLSLSSFPLFVSFLQTIV